MTPGKKENEKKRAQKRKEKEERKQERKSNTNKGKGLESMLAYVDENGNLLDSPPDQQKRVEINAADIQIGVPRRTEQEGPDIRSGIVSFFNDAKGYGFIRDLQSQANIFVHQSEVSHPLKENDKVNFETERGPKGLSAVRVKKA